MIDKKYIYHKLRYSIRRINDDEIEIRQSGLDGYFRGKIRFVLIALLLAVIYTDFKYNRPLFSDIYKPIQKDFTWAFEPDKRIMPLYKAYELRDHDPDYFKNNPENYPPMPYEEYRKPYLNFYKHFWRLNKFYLHLIWIPFVLFLIFLPKVRGLRLNRKHRMIYTNYAAVLVPDTGPPLSGLIYDRFGSYLSAKSGLADLFGGRKKFSLSIGMKADNNQFLTMSFGVHPTPNRNHNLYLIKAIREFFNEENPEFLTYIKPRYAVPMPWQNFMMFFSNAFALPSLFSQRKTRAKALARLERDWNNLSTSELHDKFKSIQDEQQALNQERQNYAFNNEVNDDWNEIDTSPGSMIYRGNQEE